MKVTIEQTIELEEVPLHANKTLMSALEQLEAVANIAKSLDVTDADNFLKNLDFVRQRMFQVDVKLAECAQLMLTYKQKGNLNNTSAPVETAPPTHVPTAQDVPQSNTSAAEMISQDEELREMYQSIQKEKNPSMDKMMAFWEKLHKSGATNSGQPIPPLPNLDLSNLQKYQARLEGLINENK